MDIKRKARAGDGLLRCIAAEVGETPNIETNKHLASCWKKYSKVKPDVESVWHYATLMEEKIYDVFIENGYDQCKKFVLDTIINVAIMKHNTSVKASINTNRFQSKLYDIIKPIDSKPKKEVEVLKNYVIQSDIPIQNEDDFIAIYGDGFTQIMKNKKDAFGNYGNWNGFTNSNNGKQTYHRILYVN